MKQISISLIGLLILSLGLFSCKKENNITQELKKLGYVETSKEINPQYLQVNTLEDFLKIKAQNPFQPGKIYELTPYTPISTKVTFPLLSPDDHEWECYFAFYGLSGGQAGSPSPWLNHYFSAYGINGKFQSAGMSVTGVWSNWYSVNLWSTVPGTYNGNPSITLRFTTQYGINALGGSGLLSEQHEVKIWKTSSNMCYIQVLY